MKKTLVAYTIIFLLFTTLIHVLTGCDSSFREKQAKEEAERKAYLEEEKRIEASIVQTFKEKHNPVHFPDASISDNVFTYKIQEFFKRNSDRLVFFKGFVEDVEETSNGLVIEFSARYGSRTYDNSSVVTFRLSSNRAQAEEIINNPPDQFWDHWSVSWIDPNYYVVCKVKDVKTISRYELKRSITNTDKEIIKPTTGIVVSGEMIDMFVKKEKKQSVPSSEIRENQKTN